MYVDKCKYGNNNGIGMDIFNSFPHTQREHVKYFVGSNT